MELEFFEKLLITALRKFDKFFNAYNYSISGITYGDRDGDSIDYRSNNSGKEIHIVFTWTGEGISMDLVFYKKKTFFQKQFFNINNSYYLFPELENLKKEITEENYNIVIESYFQFINKYFIPVVRGDKWIDDIKK